MNTIKFLVRENADDLAQQIEAIPSGMEQLAVLQALVSYAILLHFSDKPIHQSVVDGEYLLRMQVGQNLNFSPAQFSPELVSGAILDFILTH